MLALGVWIALLPGLTIAQDDFFGRVNIDLDADDQRGNQAFSLVGWVTEKVSQGLEQTSPIFSRHDQELNKLETSLFAQVDARLGEQTNFRFSAKAYHDEIYRINDDTAYSRDEKDEFRNRF